MSDEWVLLNGIIEQDDNMALTNRTLIIAETIRIKESVEGVHSDVHLRLRTKSAFLGFPFEGKLSDKV